MSVFSILLFLLPPVLGALIVLVVFEGAGSFSELVLFLILGAGIGIGLSSAEYFVWSILFQPDAHLEIFWGIQAALIVLLSGLFVRQFWNRSLPIPHVQVAPFHYETLVLGGILVVGLFFAIIHFLAAVQAEPRGSWDAIAIWNLHARFMFLGKSDWLAGFDRILFLSHPDYPYLLPGFIALCWSIFGKARFVIPNLVALFFTFANAGVLFFALTRLRDHKQALLAAIVLVSAPTYLRIGAARIADIPLSFYLLSLCVISTFFFTRPHPSRKILLLIGFLLGCLIWTKNDGWNLLLAFFLGWIIAAGLKKEIRRLFSEIPWILVGLIPMFALGIYFKTHIAPPGDMVSGVVSQGPAYLFSTLFSWTRYQTTIGWFAKDLWDLGGWKVPLVLVVGAYAVLNGLSRQTRFSRETLTIASFLVCGLAGYFFVYILTPFDLVWHLSTSLERLLLHFFPTVLFGLFYTANDLPAWRRS